ncbi:MAG: DNA replication complex GINS family protein [Candidatus Aenigmarchaeota archaeon]|nr:DNA replication complex GINS family protein [Candidatus Aenigmarchaeota archaeon]
MITFEGIRKIYEEEKKNSTIPAKLPDSFFEEIKAYIGSKKRAVSEGESSDELETAKRRLESIFELRERKIVNAALDFVRSDVEPQNLIESEEMLFREIVNNIAGFRDEMAHKLAPSKPNQIPPSEEVPETPTPEQPINNEKPNEEPTDSVVDFIDDMHEFMGTDLKPYGPFKKGDIATVPTENAKVIEKIKKGVIIRSAASGKDA